MARACTSCGTMNPNQARFCFECATPFAVVTAASHERKFATALFADIVGSTALTEREDPEVVQAMIARTFDRQAAEIERFGGVIEKFMGDGLLAIFGVPTVHEDDPERAVRSAIGMLAVLASLDRDFVAEGKAALAMRIGIEAGEVLVDLGQVRGARERMLTGDAVNTAARLQAAAEPGAIVVGPVAHEATKASVRYRQLEPLALKGKAEPVVAWVVAGLEVSALGSGGRLGLESPLIGRGEELTTLAASLEGARLSGRPAIVTVVGEAGVGKSRLAREFRDAVRERGVTWAEGRCHPYGNVSYSALAEAVKATCRIHDDDTPEVVVRAVGETVERLLGDRDLSSHLEALVGGIADRSFGRDALFDAWRRFVESMAADAPLVLAIEDAHWADDGLLEFLRHLEVWGHGPILILALTRPELLGRAPGWGVDGTIVRLDPLEDRQIEAMLEGLLHTRLPGELRRLVVERSEGNPLFGEEIVRMLIDRGVLRNDDGWRIGGEVDEAEVPRSVQALIASRIDALPDEEKASVQNASVVGRSFWLGALARLSRVSEEDARAVLDRLAAKDLVVTQPSSTFIGEPEFAFRHGLIRDVAYESLPKSFRADKHVAVARWAEQRAGEGREDAAELLATHYTHALGLLRELGERGVGDLEREAFGWARLAGDRALRLWEQREAVRWFGVAAELMGRIDLTPADRAAVHESLARASEGAEPYPVVKAALLRAFAGYQEAGAVADAARMESWLAYVSAQSGDDDEVLRWGTQALAHLEPLGESSDLAITLDHLGWYHRRRGRHAEAEPYLERAVAIAERVDDPVVRATTMLSLGALFYRRGRMEAGLAMLEAALQIARGSDDLGLLLRALLVLSEGLEESAGDYHRAVELVREGVELARRAGHAERLAWMLANLSDYLVDLGRLDEAEPYAREGLEVARRVGEVPRIGYSLVTLAYLCVLRRDVDEAEGLLGELRALMAGSAESYHLGWEPVIAGSVARGRGDETAASDIFVRGAADVGERLELWGGQQLLVEAIRSLAESGRGSEAAAFRGRLVEFAGTSVPARAYLAWADGSLDADPDALAHAAEAFEAIDRPVEQGRVLLDLGLMGDTGAAQRGRGLLTACGAQLYLPLTGHSART